MKTKEKEKISFDYNVITTFFRWSLRHWASPWFFF